jgi:hypothetical protein
MEEMGARFERESWVKVTSESHERESVEARAGRLPLRGQHRFCRHGARGLKRQS